jgi:hypothetical protein
VAAQFDLGLGCKAARRNLAPDGAKGWLRVSMYLIASVGFLARSICATLARWRPRRRLGRRPVYPVSFVGKQNRAMSPISVATVKATIQLNPGRSSTTARSGGRHRCA